jgi:N-acetyl-anhydromuramyl-L-alanine amidase AmpD
MIDILKYGKFKSIGENKLKDKIVLCHTSRNIEEYVSSLKYRYNMSYDKIPNYVVSRNGEILELLPSWGYSNFFYSDKLNQNSIVICLENLGWLEKKIFTNQYINWIGNIYSGEVYDKKWRDYITWQPYTEQQITRTSELCINLLNEFNIKKKFIGHNTKFDEAEKYSGIITRSNLDTNYTDLSPAFKFETFKKHIEYEQYTE